ncbi:aromatic compound dioxygenase [Pluteus cervinus]|uniref:Aromatic compound dioxygenase n=1 Tax=Pluteus cervinus TaxID=181527 RepID=A0ACD3AMY2_9AGAR|nr:aromatic compound dioxygenase [Pluteus cervinus]
MASISQMKDPLYVGKAIRAQLEHEIPKDLPLEKDFREGSDYTITDHVHDLHKSLCTDTRTLELVTALIDALHTFARKTKPTHAEWIKAVSLLTRAGQQSTPEVNQFVLLSDCLGLSVLLDELEHPKPPGCTEGCEPGPFFIDDVPEIPSGGSLATSETVGEKLFFEGSVKNVEGEVIPGAVVNVWQADGDGFYDVNSEVPSATNDRGKIKTLEDGSFSYRGILPTAYPIPSQGPVGEMLRALGRHSHRSAHLHFHITAPGYDDLTTALYPSHSPFLGTDPVFATKKSLICDLEQDRNADNWKRMGFSDDEVQEIGKTSGRVWLWRYNFVLPSVEAVKEFKERANLA